MESNSFYIDYIQLKDIPQFRLIGSKYRMLTNISEVIREEQISGRTLFDVFSGSASVGRYFKKSYSIVSNDILYFSYTLQRALITLNRNPTFSSIEMKSGSSDPNHMIYQVLNFLNSLDGEDGFITSHYTPFSIDIDGIQRKYFSVENGKKIDSIREKIEEWRRTNQINEDEYFYLLASLLLAVQKVANISGTYGAYNKFWDPRSKKSLSLKFIKIIPSDFEHMAYNKDIFEIVNQIETDIAYIDPPYNTRQYITNYHLLETIARYDKPKIKGKTGIREYSGKEKSIFCNKREANRYFLKLINNIKAQYILVSYNSDGIMSKEEISNIMENSDIKNIKIYEFPIRPFKSNKGLSRKTIKEYIFVGRR